MGTATAFEVGCAGCGRTREEVRFATEELCFACYRKHARASKAAAEEDRHTPSKRQRNEQASLLRNYCAIQTALIGIGATVPQRTSALAKTDPSILSKSDPVILI
jgi:hypothetical protein